MFRRIFNLSTSQPWVAEKADELMQLVFEDCNNEQQRKLVINLVSRFEYVSNARYALYIKEMAEEIVTEPGLEDFNTQLVAMAGDSSADSSQYVLYDLKVLMEQFGWRKYKSTNTFGRAYSKWKEFPEHKNIVLVDEFIGSGQTVEGRVRTLEKRFTESGVEEFKIKVKVLVSTEEGMNRLKAKDIDVTAQLTINKGITDYFPAELVPINIELMLALESILLETIDGQGLPSLGYGKAESLYCRDRGNVPNNVFPIFWWPSYKNGTNRRVLLTRAMGNV